MGLLGTLMGGSIGFFLFGPLGAIIGGAIGAPSDANRGQRGGTGPRAGIGGIGGAGGHPRPGMRPGSRPGRFNPLEAQQAFLVAMISLAAKVAKADGRVTPDEVRSFDQFLKQNLNMPAEERKVAARIFNEARDSAIPAEEFARQIREIVGSQRQRLRDLVTLLLMIALADGRLHPAEETLIRKITLELGLTDRDYENALKAMRPSASLDWAYATLGVPSDADEARVKAAYRKLAKEYHPDVLAGRGLSDDFQKFAAQKMSDVNRAFQAIREERGF